jgi:hypothetical protein
MTAQTSASQKIIYELQYRVGSGRGLNIVKRDTATSRAESVSDEFYMAIEGIVVIGNNHCCFLPVTALTELFGIIRVGWLFYQPLVGGLPVLCAVNATMTFNTGKLVMPVKFHGVTARASGSSMHRLLFRFIFLTTATGKKYHEAKQR